MPVLSTFAALSAKGYGFGSGSPLFGGGGWIGRNSVTVSNNYNATIDSSGNQFYLLSISSTSTALVKTNYQGTVSFYKSIPACLDTITLDSSGNIYLGGNQNNSTSGGGYAYIIKLDSTGALTWARTLNGLGTGVFITSIGIDGSGNVYAYGTNGHYMILTSTGSGSSNITVSTNAILKAYRDNSTGNYWTLTGALTLPASPPFLGTGSSITCRNSSNTVIFNYAPTFTGFNYIHDFVVDGSGNAYLACTNASTGTVTVNIIKINSSGTKQWSIYKGYSNSSAPLVASFSGLRIALNSDGSTVYLSYNPGTVSSATSGIVDAIETTSGTQLWSNYLQIAGAAAPISTLQYSNYNNQLILAGTRSIWDVPGNIPKVPTPGSYTVSGVNYVYYPLLNTSYATLSSSSTSSTPATSSTSLTATTITPTITNVTNTLVVVPIGTGL